MTLRTQCRTIFLISLLMFGVSLHAIADTESTVLIPTTDQANQVNRHTVGVVFTHEELFHQLVHNMEDALEPVSGLRIVPIMGKNHVQSIYDLLYLKGVDLAMVRADAVEYVKRAGKFYNIGGLVRSIAKMSEEKIVIIANTSIKSVADLRDKPVVFGTPGSGEFVTGSIAFDSLKILTESLTDSTAIGTEQLKSGEVSALIYLLKENDAIHSSADQKTRDLILKLSKDDDLHVVPISEDERLSAIYTPTKLTNDDLPSLLDEGEEIVTYSVDAILAAYRWRRDHPRLRKVSRFVTALAENLDILKTEKYQPVWERVDLKNSTPNIQRSALVQRFVDEEERLLEEQRLAEEARTKALEAAKVERLTEKRNQLIEMLSQKISSADSEDTEELSNRLNEILTILDESAEEATADSTTEQTPADPVSGEDNSEEPPSEEAADDLTTGQVPVESEAVADSTQVEATAPATKVAMVVPATTDQTASDSEIEVQVAEAANTETPSSDEALTEEAGTITDQTSEQVTPKSDVKVAETGVKVISTTPTKPAIRLLDDPVTFEIGLLENVSAAFTYRVGSITIQEKTSSEVDANGKYLSLQFALDGLEPGPHTVSIHESADCSNPGKGLNILPLVTEPVDGKIRDNIRVDGVNIRAFLNRSIVITNNAVQDGESIMCGTSI